MTQRISHVYAHIDSADRDLTTNPNPYQFRHRFDTTYRNVLGIELVSADFPFTAYTVIQGVNDTFNFEYQGEGTEFTVTLDAGDYTASTLATHLKAQMEAADSSSASYSASTWTISISNNKFVFANSAADFNILMSTGTNADTTTTDSQTGRQYVTLNGSARTLLGFNLADAASSSQTLTAPNKYDLSSARYVFMIMRNGATSFDNIDVNSSSGIHNSVFAKIQFGTNSANTIVHYQSDYEVRKEFTQPIEKMTYVDLELRTWGGFFYDPQGIDWSMLVRIYTLEENL